MEKEENQLERCRLRLQACEMTMEEELDEVAGEVDLCTRLLNFFTASMSSFSLNWRGKNNCSKHLQLTLDRDYG